MTYLRVKDGNNACVLLFPDNGGSVLTVTRENTFM